MTAPATLKRGAHVLPHQSQVTRRDLHAEHIGRCLGGSAHAYRLTAEQVAERRVNGPYLPYEFVLSAPESAALSWCAFYTRDDLAAFCDAYGLTLDHEPAPGERFTVILPANAANWRPLEGLESVPTLEVVEASDWRNQQLRAVSGFGIGDRVTIRGGFEDGLTGVIVANEPDRSCANPYGQDRPFRFRVRIASCPYCGDGACSGSARTANGRDVERWHAVHTSKVPSPGTVGGLHPWALEHISQ